MVGRKKNNKDESSSARPERRKDSVPLLRRFIVSTFVMLMTVSILGGAGYLVYSKTNLIQKLQAQAVTAPPAPAPTQMRVVLARLPAWIPASLGQQIAASLTPADVKPSDPQLAQKVFTLASSNPWISKVHLAVTKPSTDPKLVVVEVQADYRAAAAKVTSQNCGGVEYVSYDGCRLPTAQVPQCIVNVPATAGKAAYSVYFVNRADVPRGWRIADIHYMTIEGVTAAPPEFGAKWQGEDLTDGLRLLKVVSTRKYANQITTIDVRNYFTASGLTPKLAMRAKVGNGPETIIKFGNLPDPNGDWEVPTDRKMQFLDSFVSMQNGSLTGIAAFVDLRYGELLYKPLGS